ncbi:MAG: 4-(cytidine 5'-diphospho)-2-C-methyl-D-erythritol kinase [Hyphomicrobiales bacterium]
MPGAVTEAARAKVNLTLAIVGRRSDGYHLLDSIAAFADIADRLEFEKSSSFELSIDGPFAASVPSDGSNLIARAARALFTELPPVRIDLEKNIPVAAGLGGGSADAAATLRGLAKLFELNAPDLPAVAAGLGADVPMCLCSTACRLTGAGEVVSPMPRPRPRHALLINPGVSLPTAAVFRELDASATRSRRRCRNDLTAPAMRLAPVIRDVLDELKSQPGATVVRMSGSGPTCFGLFSSASQADYARFKINAAHPTWWCRRSVLT